MVSALQAAGVAAAKSQNSVDMIADPALWERGFYPEITQFDGTAKPVIGPSWRMSRGATITDGAPGLGEHTAYVLGEILGLSPEELQHLAEAGITR